MATYIPRIQEAHIMRAQEFFPVTLVTGARQVGKSTLCRHMFPDYALANLEDITTRSQAMQDPTGFLNDLGDRIILDEVQNVPEIFSQIQANVDADPNKKYVLTGSSDFRLMKHACQSMAGRVSVHVLYGLTFEELGAARIDIPTDNLMLTGIYPGVWSGKKPLDLFYPAYYNIYVERDIRTQLKPGNLMHFDRFIRLMAGRTGSEFKASALATEVGVSATTINEWVSMLMASYIIFPLQPYFANIGKRLTKMPKYYFQDTGLLCFLLGITEPSQLKHHPLRGAVFENMAVSQLWRKFSTDYPGILPMYFYREHSGREIDILKENPLDFEMFEIKSAMTYRPEWTANMDGVASLLPSPSTRTVIYDGPTLGNAVNIRDI